MDRHVANTEFTDNMLRQVTRRPKGSSTLSTPRASTLFYLGHVSAVVDLNHERRPFRAKSRMCQGGATSRGLTMRPVFTFSVLAVILTAATVSTPRARAELG